MMALAIFTVHCALIFMAALLCYAAVRVSISGPLSALMALLVAGCVVAALIKVM